MGENCCRNRDNSNNNSQNEVWPGKIVIPMILLKFKAVVGGLAGPVGPLFFA